MSRRVVLVCGPPCAGKTWYVNEHAGPDDLILDADDIARRLGSPAKWKHSPAYRDAADEIMRQRMADIAQADSGQAWVIRSAPEASARQALADYLRADEVVVLTPDRAVLYARAAKRPAGTRGVIDRWFARYSAATTR